MIITWFYRLEYLNDISIHAFTRCSFFDSSYKSLPLKLWQQADFHKIAEVAQLLSKFVKTVHWRVLIFIYSYSASKNTLESIKKLFLKRNFSSKIAKFKKFQISSENSIFDQVPAPQKFFHVFYAFLRKKTFLLSHHSSHNSF